MRHRWLVVHQANEKKTDSKPVLTDSILPVLVFNTFETGKFKNNVLKCQFEGNMKAARNNYRKLQQFRVTTRGSPGALHKQCWS